MRINNDQTIEITELPIGTWSHDYERKLVKWEDEGKIGDFKVYCTDDKVRFIIDKYSDGTPTLKKLGLITNISHKNMTVLYWNETRDVINPKIYNDLTKLLQDFYKIRLEKYFERKNLMLLEFDKDIHDLSERARFIRAVAVDQVLEIRNRPEDNIHNDMSQMKFDHALLDKVKTRELNKDRIPKLYQQIQDKIEEKKVVEAQTPQHMWYTEIEQFIMRFCKEEKCMRSTLESCNPPLTVTI